MKDEWISCSDRLPDRPGEYLVLVEVGTKPPCYIYDVLRFAGDLSNVDEYDFCDDHHPGWYDYDFESGYYENWGVTYWMPLPDKPKGGTNG